MHLVVWGNFETDNRRRKSGYAIPEVFYPCFLLFSPNIFWCIWWFGETLRRIIGGRGVDMQSLVFFFFSNYFLEDLVVWGNFETDNRRRRSGYAIPEVFYPCFLLFSPNIFWCIWWFGETSRRIIGGGRVDMQSLKFSILVFFFFLQTFFGAFGGLGKL